MVREVLSLAWSGVDSHENVLVTCNGHDDCIDWDFDDVPGEYRDNVRARICRGMQAVHELGGSADGAVTEEARRVFNLALTNLNSIMDRASAVASKVV